MEIINGLHVYSTDEDFFIINKLPLPQLNGLSKWGYKLINGKWEMAEELEYRQIASRFYQVDVYKVKLQFGCYMQENGQCTSDCKYGVCSKVFDPSRNHLVCLCAGRG